MKKLIYLFCFALISCAAPKATITGIGYENGKATVTGNLIITTPTQAQADSAASKLTKDVFSIKHISDSANVHLYQWKFISPNN